MALALRSAGRLKGTFLRVTLVSLVVTSLSPILLAQTVTVEQEIVRAFATQVDWPSNVLITVGAESIALPKAVTDGDYARFSEELRSEVSRRYTDRDLQGALEDFLAKNRTNTSVKLSSTNGETKINWIPTVDTMGTAIAKTVSGRSAWEEFQSKHPGITNLINVSALGVDRSLSVAILYGEHRMLPTDGSGRMYVLRYINKRWVLQTRISFGPRWAS